MSPWTWKRGRMEEMIKGTRGNEVAERIAETTGEMMTGEEEDGRVRNGADGKARAIERERETHIHIHKQAHQSERRFKTRLLDVVKGQIVQGACHHCASKKGR